MTDPSQVADLLREQSRRTTTRSELERRHPDLQRASPRVGVLDEDAVAAQAATDPDAAVNLLADLARATDPAVRAAARRLAVRLLVPPPRAGEPERAGSARLATVAGEGLDLDLDATLERRSAGPAPLRLAGGDESSVPLRSAGGAARSIPLHGSSSAALRLREEDLRWRGWRSPSRALVLLVDASGSVAGTPLTTAVTTAGALAAGLRPDDELGVVAFWSRAVVLRHVRSPRPAAGVLDALLDLRGGSTTDLALGLRTALAQAAVARAPRTEVLVLSDGAWNEGDDPVPVAAAAAASGARVHTLVTVDTEQARATGRALAGAGGGRSVPLLRSSAAPAAVREVLR